MIAYVLTFVVFIAKASPITVSGIFDDRLTCGLKENAVVTAAMEDKDVSGFVILNDCTPVKEVNKT